jgi:hypothetical protein
MLSEVVSVSRCPNRWMWPERLAGGSLLARTVCLRLDSGSLVARTAHLSARWLAVRAAYIVLELHPKSAMY